VHVQPTTESNSKKYSHARKNGITTPLIDEGSTSGKRKVGGYMLSLQRVFVLMEQLKRPASNGTVELNVILKAIMVYRCSDPDLSITTDYCLFAATSDMAVSTTSGEQRSHQRHPKKCRFNGCSKGARGVS
jgi:hypothetical protein